MMLLTKKTEREVAINLCWSCKENAFSTPYRTLCPACALRDKWAWQAAQELARELAEVAALEAPVPVEQDPFSSANLRPTWSW